MGTGTTIRMANMLGRSAIGVDLDPPEEGFPAVQDTMLNKIEG